MDKAGQLMASLPMDRAARDMSGAVDVLAEHPATTGDGIGVVGFCMGGGLALTLGTMRPDKVKAVVTYYGVLGFDDDGAPDWSNLEAPVLGHYGEADDFFPADKARELEAGLKGLGKSVDLVIYEGRGHAFASAHDALGTYHAEDAGRAWQHTISFLHQHLG
jgi:carboxymethylenebutenolidase